MRDLGHNLHACSINTATLGFRAPIRTVIDDVARAGFGHIAPWRRELEGQSVAAVSQHIRDAGLEVTGYCRSSYLPAATAQQRRASIEDNKQAIDDAAALGAESFVLVVGSLPEGSKNLAEARKQVIDALPELLAHARSVDVKLSLEPMHPVYAADRGCISRLSQALDICDAVEGTTRTPFLGVLIDVYHVWWDPNLMHDIARAGAEHRIFGFHVNDWLATTRDPLNDRGMMGDGVIDIRAIRGHVESAGFSGPVEVEIFSVHNWWNRPAQDILRIAAARLATAT